MDKNIDDSIFTDGVTTSIETVGNIVINWTKVLNAHGSEALARPVGNYIMIQSDVMKSEDFDELEEINNIVTQYLSRLIKLEENDSVLVVGLGNQNIEADALGTRVAWKIYSSRHLVDSKPNEDNFTLRSVSVITPGVMGNTGINTRDIIKGICEQIRPSLVITIDALVANKTERLYNTIQISDTGISPGAGMGHSMGVINADFLGTPIISIGVPTTIKANTLVRDTLELALSFGITDPLDEKERLLIPISNK